MSRYRKLCFILIQLCLVIVCNAQVDYFETSTTWDEKEYVDPHSFYYDKNTQTDRLPRNDDRTSIDYAGPAVESCESRLNRCKIATMSTNTDIPDETLSRRLVSMLMNRASFKKEGAIFIGHIDLQASEAQLKALGEFGAGKLSLREIDPILNDVLKAPDVNRIYEAVLTMQTFSVEFFSFVRHYKEAIIGTITLIYLYWTLRNVKWTFRKILSIGIPIILVASFLITWWKLIEEAQIKHMVLQVKHMQVPAQCLPDSMGWTDKIRAFFYTDDCEKYYEGLMKNPELQVTPAQALTHMAAHMIYEPIALSGKTIASFLDTVTGNMPWWLSYPVQVTVCIGFIPTLICFVILLAGGSLNLGFGPFSLFSLQGPGNSDRRQDQHHKSTIDRRPIENMPNVTFNVHIQDSGGVEITSSDRSHRLAISRTAAHVRSERSNNLALEVNSEAATSANQPNHSGDLASGDSICANKSNSSDVKSDDSKVIDTVRESIKPESGSGDN